jgi:hypothetical protein
MELFLRNAVDPGELPAVPEEDEDGRCRGLKAPGKGRSFWMLIFRIFCLPAFHRAISRTTGSTIWQ